MITVVNTLLILATLCLIYSSFNLWRNQFVYERKMFANKLITKYTDVLIEERNYKNECNYYCTMTKKYEDLLYKEPFNFNKYSAIKPEYVELLKQYDEESTK